MLNRLLIGFIIALFYVLPVYAGKELKTILILHSYNQGLLWTDEINKAVTLTIDADSLILPDFRIEYIDSKHYESTGYFNEFTRFFLSKYRNTRFDIVIVSDNAAYSFLANFRDSLPGKPPVIFCGLNYAGDIPVNFTGIMEDIDIASNIGTILSIHPDYKKIYMVADRTITGNIIRKKAIEIISKHYPDLIYEFITDYSYHDLKIKLSELGNGDVVLLTTFNTDKNGESISYDHILDNIKPVCKVPVYGTWDFYLNKGIVGGKIVKASTHGEYAGRLALRVLKGTPAASVPVTVGPTEYIFDNRVLNEFKISKAQLPSGAIVINSPYSFIKENLQLVGFISVLFLLMLILILVFVQLFNKEKQIRKKEQIFNSEIKNKSIELENALLQAEKSNQLKTAFLSNLSHEIRTPMNAIVGFSDLLISNYPDKKLEEYVSIIRASSSQLLSIINDIIEMSMVDTNQVQLHYSAVNVNHTLEEVCNTFSFRIETELILKKNFPEDLNPVVLVDEIKFRQILTNLISNAFKFTEKGFVEVGYSHEKGFLQFYVKDTGIGIDPQYHQEIFERFWRVDHSDLSLFRGLGIGLTLCDSFVKLMGGNIWLKSQPGKGSTFYFTIPYKNEVVLEQKTAGKETPEFNNQVILICEDDENNLYYFRELFSKTKTTLIWARNGHEAVSHCRENMNISLVLMDLKMPEMNGWEATKIIKSIRPDLPVIAQTAHALTIEINQLNNKGFDDYVTKPINKSELFAKISRYLENSNDNIL